jgi:Multiubiquitin
MSDATATTTKEKFEINIEGHDYGWDESTITVPQLRALAGIPAGQQMMEVDLKTNVERTLEEDEVVTLRPGHGFAKKIRYQRG